MLDSLFAFIVVLGVIIFCHEFGHFITAKAFGMRVFIFSFGFGKRLAGFKWGETDCRLSLVPLGGYVKLEGEPEDHLSEDTSRLGDGKDFTSRPRWQRFIVYLAGPFMNGVLTVAIVTALFMVGMNTANKDKPVVGSVVPGSPAEAAGIEPGDEFLAIDGQAIASWEALVHAVLLRPNAEIAVRLRRGGEERSLVVHSTSREKEQVGHIGVEALVRVGNVVKDSPAERAGLKAADGLLRVGDRPVRSFDDIPAVVTASAGQPVTFAIYREGSITEVPITPRKDPEGWKVGIGSRTEIRKLGLGGAVTEALRWTWTNTKLTLETLKRLVTGRLSVKTLSGPLGIARISGEAARESPLQLVFVVAFLSLQVGILNLFPLAPLDGGHLAILLGESIIRRDFSMAVKAWLMNAGAMMLFLLIGIVLYSDLSKTGWLGNYLP